MGPSALQSVGARELKSRPVYDVGASVKSWGRRGIAWGGAAGFALGVVFVAIPLTSDILTFGILGTLIVATVEGAVVAGAFGAIAAALYGNGVLQSGRPAFDRGRIDSRRVPWSDAQPVGIPMSDRPAQPAFTGFPAANAKSVAADDAHSVRQSLRNARFRLNAIDAWENGNTGP